MTRRRWIYKNGEAFEVTPDHDEGPSGLLVIGDLPGYQSPVTGLWVEGRRARREDLKRTGSRPFEGIAQERKEAARQEAYREQRIDAHLTKTAHEVLNHMPRHKRDILLKGY